MQLTSSRSFRQGGDVSLSGLISIFKSKMMHAPASHPVYVWQIIARHAGDEDPFVRKVILQFISCLHATSGYVFFTHFIARFIAQTFNV